MYVLVSYTAVLVSTAVVTPPPSSSVDISGNPRSPSDITPIGITTVMPINPQAIKHQLSAQSELLVAATNGRGRNTEPLQKCTPRASWANLLKTTAAVVVVRIIPQYIYSYCSSSSANSCQCSGAFAL